jgi:hypothetical protein
MNQTFLPMPFAAGREVEGRRVELAGLGVAVLDGLGVAEGVAVPLGLGVQVAVGVSVAVGTSVAAIAVGEGAGRDVGVGELHATSARRSMARNGRGEEISRAKRGRMGLLRPL